MHTPDPDYAQARTTNVAQQQPTESLQPWLSWQYLPPVAWHATGLVVWQPYTMEPVWCGVWQLSPSNLLPAAGI